MSAPATAGETALEAVLTQAINRLEAVLAGESNALSAGRRVNLGEIANRKNQSLMELSRIARGLEPGAMSAELRDRIGTLRERLDDNGRILKLHMEATEEISAIISRTLTDAESDGTYGSNVNGVTAGR